MINALLESMKSYRFPSRDKILLTVKCFSFNEMLLFWQCSSPYKCFFRIRHSISRCKNVFLTKFHDCGYAMYIVVPPESNDFHYEIKSLLHSSFCFTKYVSSLLFFNVLKQWISSCSRRTHYRWICG